MDNIRLSDVEAIRIMRVGGNLRVRGITSGNTSLQCDTEPQIRRVENRCEVLIAGNATITAELTNADGSVASGTATVAVSNTPAPEPLLSLTIIPNSITVGNLQDTGNFLAVGTFSAAPYVRD